PGRTHFDEDFALRAVFKRPVADPIDRAQPHAARAQRLARADNDTRRICLEPDHIERSARGDAKAPALSDSEVDDAAVAAEHAPVEIDDVARRCRPRLETLDH